MLACVTVTHDGLCKLKEELLLVKDWLHISCCQPSLAVTSIGSTLTPHSLLLMS